MTFKSWLLDDPCDPNDPLGLVVRLFVIGIVNIYWVYLKIFGGNEP